MLKTNDLRHIVMTVCQRARQQGFVEPQEVRDELVGAGMPEAQWAEVVSMAGYMLTPRDGRFYFSAAAAASHRQQRCQRRLNLAVRKLIRGYRTCARQERRRRGRIVFVEPVLVETEDGRSFTLLSADLSVNGIRLIGSESLLGQKIRVTLPTTEGARYRRFTVQIMWSSCAGQGLCENGGAFVGIVKDIPLAILGPFPRGYVPAVAPPRTELGACSGPSRQPHAR